MLSPNSRLLYLDSLRPPEGFTLERGLATTFSLDLFTLLSVPFSLAALELAETDRAHPLALLESLRRIARKVTVFCQQGRITVPPADQLLYSHLESAVVEVKAPNRGGVFHPKIWLLRFVAEDRPTCYRFLCLSRNLTSDRSWDTVLALDGVVRNRRFGRNRPLADFIRELPSLAVQVSGDLAAEVADLAEELMRVDFELPGGFEDLHFHPVGIPSHRRLRLRPPHNRILVVSPFLTDALLSRVATDAKEALLVSRQDSLDQLSKETLELFSRAYVLNDAADAGSVIADTEEETEETDPQLSGLHAKLFVTENGWDAAVWTGSANATNAAFDGRNVEFAVELQGKKSRVGIDRILDSNRPKGNESLLDLLVPYMPGEAEAVKALRELEERLDAVRDALSGCGLTLKATKTGDVYDLELSTCQPVDLPDGVQAECWPITLRQAHGQDIRALEPGNPLLFTDLAAVSLTSFMAFELSAADGDIKHSIRFVLNLPLEDGPADREDQVLRHIISDREGFIRYVLLLLYEGGVSSVNVASLLQRGRTTRDAESKAKQWQQPLLEELVRAYSRNPDKLKRIGKLVEDLRHSGAGEVIPEGFDEIWNALSEGLR